MRSCKITFQDALRKINNLNKSHWQGILEETSITNILKEIKTWIAPWKSPSPQSSHEELVIARTRIRHLRLTNLPLITKKRLPYLQTLKQRNNHQTHHTRMPKVQQLQTNFRKPINYATNLQYNLQIYIQFFHKYKLSKITVE